MNAAEQTRTIESDGNGSDPAGRISFSDVARAHYHWNTEEEAAAAEGWKITREQAKATEEARGAYERALARFERQVDASVVDAYWCQKQASGVVLARKPSEPPGRLRRLWRRLGLSHEVPEYRLFRETDWVTIEFPRLANLLHECDVLAIKAIWGLEGIHQAVVMPWLMAVEAHILGFIERDWRRRVGWEAGNGSQPAVERETAAERRRRKQDEREHERAADRFYADTLRELNRIEDYYQKAGEKRGRLHYLSGMVVFGVLIVASAAAASAGVLWMFGVLDVDRPDIQRFYACIAAGALGAIVSVLMRMSRRDGFTIDHELGSTGVRRLGAFRPLIGAVSGVVVSLLVQTPLVPIEDTTLTIEFSIVAAFLAGFSERWTKVVLDGAMRTIEGSGEEPGGRTAQLAGAAAVAADDDLEALLDRLEELVGKADDAGRTGLRG